MQITIDNVIDLSDIAILVAKECLIQNNKPVTNNMIANLGSNIMIMFDRMLERDVYALENKAKSGESINIEFYETMYGIKLFAPFMD